MSKVWKWILGIVIVLVVLGAIAGVFLMVRSHSGFAFASRSGLRPTVPDGQNVPGAPKQPTTPNSPGSPTRPNYPGGMMRPGWYGPGMRGYGPMMGGRGFMPMERGFGPFGMFMPFGMGFFFLGALLRVVIPIGVLVVVAFVFYQLGKRSGMTPAVAPQAAPAPDDAADDKPKSRVRRS